MPKFRMYMLEGLDEESLLDEAAILGSTQNRLAGDVSQLRISRKFVVLADKERERFKLVLGPIFRANLRGTRRYDVGKLASAIYRNHVKALAPCEENVGSGILTVIIDDDTKAHAVITAPEDDTSGSFADVVFDFTKEIATVLQCVVEVRSVKTRYGFPPGESDN